jgi:hypothetical protein
MRGRDRAAMLESMITSTPRPADVTMVVDRRTQVTARGSLDAAVAPDLERMATHGLTDGTDILVLDLSAVSGGDGAAIRHAPAHPGRRDRAVGTAAAGAERRRASGPGVRWSRGPFHTRRPTLTTPGRSAGGGSHGRIRPAAQ